MNAFVRQPYYYRSVQSLAICRSEKSYRTETNYKRRKNKACSKNIASWDYDWSGHRMTECSFFEMFEISGLLEAKGSLIKLGRSLAPF